jgi:hypothetical protein
MQSKSRYLPQTHAHSVGCMQQTLHLRAFRAITTTIRSLIIASPLAEEFSDILDALRLLLILAHHTEGGREEFLAVLHLIGK